MSSLREILYAYPLSNPKPVNKEGNSEQMSLSLLVSST